MPKADQQPLTADLTDDEDKLAAAQKLLHLARRYLNRKDKVHASIALARAEEIVTSVAVKQAEDDLPN
jgi:hypothetical protein